MFSQSLSSRGLIVSIYSLVFSQSLLSLDLIELYLEYWDTGLGKTGDKKEEKKDKKTSGDDDDHPVSHLPLSLPTPSLPPALLPPLPASIPLYLCSSLRSSLPHPPCLTLLRVVPRWQANRAGSLEQTTSAWTGQRAPSSDTTRHAHSTLRITRGDPNHTTSLLAVSQRL